MVTAAAQIAPQPGIQPHQSPIVAAIDRWMYVGMAVFFLTVTLAGFVPDSVAKIASVEAGIRPPFPLVLHLHAVLMGAFLVLLLAQSTLAATGRQAYHQQLGLTAFVLVPALVIVGVILSPTMYHQFWNLAQTAPAEFQAQIQQGLSRAENIMLMQIRVGIVFPLFITIALLARKTDPGLHKRLMFLATAVALPAAITRIGWLPQSFPESPLYPHLYMLLAASPMLLWDLYRSRTLHRAYVIWLAVMVPSALVIHGLWDTPWWHATAQRLMGV